MKIYLPYTNVAPGVEEALAATGRDYELVKLTFEDDYYAHLHALWQDGEPFINVEHDVIVRPDTFDELEACPEPWCAFTVPYFVGNYPGLACAKFTVLPPGLMDRVGAMEDATHPRRHWCRLDGWMQIQMQLAGLRQHVHEPPLGHYRADNEQPWPSHGCVHPQE